jgi:hypothetical protein
MARSEHESEQVCKRRHAYRMHLRILYTCFDVQQALHGYTCRH